MFFSTVWYVSKHQLVDDVIIQYRRGAIICLVAFFIAGWTVHYWNATFVLLIFLIGSVQWVRGISAPEPIGDPGSDDIPATPGEQKRRAVIGDIRTDDKSEAAPT